MNKKILLLILSLACGTLANYGMNIHHDGNPFVKPTHNPFAPEESNLFPATRKPFNTSVRIYDAIKQINTTVQNATEQLKTPIQVKINHEDISRLIKTSLISCAGLSCCIGSTVIFVNGIKKLMIPQQAPQNNNQDNNSSVWNRCKNIFTSKYVTGPLTCGIGIAGFIGGLYLIAKSDTVLDKISAKN